MKRTIRRNLLAALLPFTVVLSSPAAHAHGTQPASGLRQNPVSTEEHAFGQQGDPVKATRTVRVTMDDAMRFAPDELVIRQGETVRFIVVNHGKILHEMVLGTMQELKAHGEMMRQHPGMAHDAPYMAHVEAGKSGEMAWRFTQPGEFYFACLVPGHLEAGMLGKIRVLKG